MIYENRMPEYLKSRILWPVAFKSIGSLKTLPPFPSSTKCLSDEAPFYSRVIKLPAVCLLIIIAIIVLNMCQAQC